MSKNKYSVVFTVFNRRNGDIAIEQGEAVMMAYNKGVAVLTIVTELRDSYPDSEWRIIIHEANLTDD
jgi:hypothetical protein